MIPVSNYVQGLAALLNSKNSGKLPHSLGEVLSGVVDVSQLLLLNTRESVNLGQRAAPVVGTNFYTTGIFGTVPPGELWYVWNYGASVFPGVGESITYQVAYQLEGGSTNIPIGDLVTSGASTRGYAYAAREFWLGPGGRFSFNCQSVNLPGNSVEGLASITRLRV